MSELRRRANSARTGDEDEAINEPLLAEGGGPQSSAEAAAPSLVAVLLLGWEAMVYYVNWLMNLSFGLPPPEKVSKFTKLRDSTKLPYSEDDPEHQVELAALWKQCFPDEPWFCGPSARWKDAGFQGNNPASDFRGGGIFSLRNLIYMGKHHHKTFKRLMLKETGERSDFEYPFCAAGINLTFYLQQLLELRGGPAGKLAPTGKVGRHFINMFYDDDHAFEEMYVASFEVLDRIWLERGASYMEFPTVLSDTMEAVKEAMLENPEDCAELRKNLGLETQGSQAEP